MAVQAYLFEAKSIQAWIFSGGKLADMVAASDLLESLTGKMLDEVLSQLPDSASIRFTRRAGGTFYALSDRPDGLLALRRLWNWILPQVAPGLPWSDCLCEGEDARGAIKAGIAQLAIQNNQPPPTFPETTTLMQRAPRTGKAAVTVDMPSGNPEWIDEDLAARRKFKRLNQRSKEASTLELKFTPEICSQPVIWPTDLQAEEGEQAFPFAGEQDLIALVHADGNGLGQILQKMDAFTEENPEAYEQLYSEFSSRLEQATQAAARHASEQVLLPARSESGVLPARPLILGGDDVTLIVRGDLALDYAEAFLTAFEAQSERALNDLAKVMQKQAQIRLPADFPKKLFACAGVAFIKPKQPFFLAYSLCEALCSEAKKAVNRVKSANQGQKCSGLAFYRLMQTTAERPAQMLSRETRYPARSGLSPEFMFWLGAYGLPGTQGLPALAALKSLAAQVLKYPAWQTRLRQVLSLAAISPDEARKILRRWDELSTKRFDTRSASLSEGEDFQGLMESLLNLGGVLAEDGHDAVTDSHWSPLVSLRPETEGAPGLVAAPLSELMVLAHVWKAREAQI